MSDKGKVQDALELSEELLSSIELEEGELTQIALKASRLARLVGDFEKMEILKYEAGGYPTELGIFPPKIWKLVEAAGRTYKVEDDKNEQGFRVIAYWHSVGELQIELEELRSRLSGLPSGTLRNSIQKSVRQVYQRLSQRRMWIHDYIVSVYYELKFSAVALGVFDRTRARVDKGIGELIPEAVRKFSAVYENLASSNTEDWSNAVHSCRRILQDTADVLYPAREDKVVKVPGGKDKVVKLGPDNYVNRLVAYAEENSESGRFQEIVGSHMRYLGERLDSIFHAAQKGSHAVIASQDEADRYVVFTYLLVGDILRLSDHKTGNEGEAAKPSQ